MTSDPGICTTPADTRPTDKLNAPLPWYARPRWSEYAGGRPPITKKRASLIAKKRAWARNEVALDECRSGKELVAGYFGGRLTPYPLEHRPGVLVSPPSEELQRRLVGAKWRLRGTRVRVLAWIATAMIPLRGAGLVVSHDQLGELCGVRRDRIGQIMHDLRAWGLVRSSPTFTAHGEATSQRENCYRLTKLCSYVYGLPWLGTGVLPDAEPDVAPRIARAPGSQKTTVHPESTLGETSNSGREVELSAVSVEADCPDPTSVTDASPCGPSLTVTAETSDVLNRLGEPESSGRKSPGVDRDASSGRDREPDAVGNLVERVKHDRVIERPRPNTEAPRDTRRISRRRGDEARDHELVDELEYERTTGRALDVAAEKLQRPVRSGPTDDDDLNETIASMHRSWERTQGRRRYGRDIAKLRSGDDDGSDGDS